MNISELSLRRPVLAVVMNIIIVVFGVIGFMAVPTLTSLKHKLPSHLKKLLMELPV